MKILFIIDYFQPQIGYSEVFLLKEFVRLGHTVEVLTSNHYFPFPNYADTVQSLLGSRTQPIGRRIEEGLSVQRQRALIDVGNRVIFSGLVRKISEYKPDLVIVNGIVTFSALVASVFKQIYQYRLILRDSHLYSEYNRGPQLLKKLIYGSFRLFAKRIVEKNADAIVAAADGTKVLATEVYGIRKPIVVIPLGTDPKLYAYSKQKRLRFRKKVGIKNSDFVILYTGKVIPAKGLELFFRAFQRLVSKHPSLILVIVGAGSQEYTQQCLKLVEKKYRQQVIFTGFKGQADLPEIYAAADIAVWPLQETTSMLDAASSQLPFIVNDQIGTQERISYRNALTYKKGQDVDLAHKISFLLTHPTERKEMGRRGRKLILDTLSWRQLAQTYLRLVSL